MRIAPQPYESPRSSDGLVALNFSCNATTFFGGFMGDTCAVSILVPICNVERYLGECLESLVNQTLEDLQIICIDDGSSDSSPLILEE